MRLLLIAPLLLAGCAPMTWQGSQDYVARQSNFNVCRLTMGGPHSQMAQHEAVNRGLDCTQYYGAIVQQQANENAATQQYINTLRPPPPTLLAPPQQINCQTFRTGNTLQTNCN